MLQKCTAYRAIGGTGLVLSAGYLTMSFGLPFGQVSRPGAAVFPVLVGVILMLASLTVIWESWKLKRTEAVELPRGSDRRRLLGLMGLLLGYFLALPWMGQLLSSTLFCILLIRLLSNVAWPRIIIYSVVISVTLYIVFIHLLNVPMPRGILAF